MRRAREIISVLLLDFVVAERGCGKVVKTADIYLFGISDELTMKDVDVEISGNKKVAKKANHVPGQAPKSSNSPCVPSGSPSFPVDMSGQPLKRSFRALLAAEPTEKPPHVYSEN